MYAVNADALLHRAAKAWWQKTLSGDGAVGLSWSVMLAYLRLTTRSRAFGTPLRMETGFAIVERWIEQPGVQIVEPGP